MAPKKKQNETVEGALPAKYHKEMADQGWKRQGGDVLKWDAGMEVEGRLVKIKPARDEDSSPVLIIETDNGIEQYWCPTILENRMEGVNAGDQIKIICLGQTVKVKNRTQKAWGFELYVKPE